MANLCPKCKSATLEPLSAARSRAPASTTAVPPSQCSSCGGVWMPHGALSLDTGLAAVAPGKHPPAAADLDAKVGFCPSGHGLLIRARVEAAHPFHLDRCGTCAGIWFDSGEWAALASTEWMHHLDDLWDPVYRKRMREARSRRQHVEELTQALGAETAGQVVRLVEQLKENPRRSLAVAYLLDELKEG